MSLFPKRTVPGKGVTIHWHFQGPNHGEKTLFPHVRIQVRDPEGDRHTLWDGPIFAFPSQASNASSVASMPGANTERVRGRSFPGSSTPLLVLASMLEGKQKRERLHSLLQGLNRGRHFYFHFPILESAPLGRYVLESHLLVEGDRRASETVEEDCFFVERPELESLSGGAQGPWKAWVRNESAEALPTLILQYARDGELSSQPRALDPQSTEQIELQSSRAYLVYSEGREWLDLSVDKSPLCIRNQEYLWLKKTETNGNVVTLIHRETQAAYALEGPYTEIWLALEGHCTRNDLWVKSSEAAYAEMLAEGLIQEIAWPFLPTLNQPSLKP